MSFYEWLSGSQARGSGAGASEIVRVFPAGRIADSLLGVLALTALLCAAEFAALYAFYYLRYRRCHP